ncbi:deoxyribodipyrimidine photo-lyase [Antrihabitans sp. YC2-6]|uniref:cryptochrome/photolyase family protein n=1 Tax=Antrihabitans sp. YC2-6 TaxID=2799498 RepID=UPI0018F541E1|nr:deoxyribodipyrimidine photo-lyase [Antrihabitans sp. YC2-6]MBJ8346774.1 deoxyribodipyrimidine photo-lyase [Antrihabitans sp. YC2-6]
MDRTAIVWFRRDLRVGDLPTLSSAADAASDSMALFVLDDRLLGPAGSPRRVFLFRCLRELDAQLDGRLLVLHGDPVEVVPRLAEQIGAGSVHVSADFGPYGTKRDERVAEALGDVELIATGSPYAVAPGRLTKGDGTPYKVFTPFRRAWYDHGWRLPAKTDAGTVSWLDPADIDGRIEIPDDDSLDGIELPPAGEAAALERWDDFRENALTGYNDERDRADLDNTSRMSVYLKFGCVHPRTMLRDLRGDGAGRTTYRSELAWRDFYADVLFHRPETARENYNERFDAIEYNSGADADKAFQAWCDGRTGFPIVDAGMRQLRAEGWMHNRVRMITASFLTKDLHLPWWWGARHFMTLLADGDIASNQHGWQWTAGCGTDAAPYFRVFNPTTQGEKFDPKGEYVRRWVPELRDVAGAKVHKLDGDRPAGYPAPIVDHQVERKVALSRYDDIKRAEG